MFSIHESRWITQCTLQYVRYQQCKLVWKHIIKKKWDSNIEISALCPINFDILFFKFRHLFSKFDFCTSKFRLFPGKFLDFLTIPVELCVFWYSAILTCPESRVGGASYSGAVDQRSIPGRVIPMTLNRGSSHFLAWHSTLKRKCND